MPWQERDWMPYQDLSHADGPMWMDALHVEALYELWMAIRPTSILELGCFDGFSTSAAIQAKADGVGMSLTCVDREIRPSLYQIVRRCRTNWHLAQCDSRVALEQHGVTDVLMIDTDHDIDTTQQEAKIALRRGWQTIVAHDVGLHGGCPGPQWLRKHLEVYNTWLTVVDEKPREGMRTDRGLMLATRVESVYAAAKVIFDKLATA